MLGAAGHPWAEPAAEVREPVPPEDVVPEPVRLRRSAPSGSFGPRSVGAMFTGGGVLMSRARTPRRQQIEMAELVASGLDSGGRRLIEAPTGTGKMLAYLARPSSSPDPPATRWSSLRTPPCCRTRS
ncbi:MAG: hypothetical protein F4004_02835 [Acidimicrobiia bacterium]|nr:hypothetical protein [Acidimicrobiia bacterium]MYC44060.1 hypothetical protein [Acidimicrobiia bacterium]